MTKQASIAYLSDLMDHPGRITDADMNSIGGFRQSFPYFVPARYLEAYHKNKTAAFSPALLSSMNSYMGDWMMFCDFLNSEGSYEAQPAVTPDRVAEADVEQAANLESAGNTPDDLSGIEAPVADSSIVSELPQIIEGTPTAVSENVLSTVDGVATNAPEQAALPEVGADVVAAVSDAQEEGKEIVAHIAAEDVETVVAEMLPTVEHAAPLLENDVVVQTVEVPEVPAVQEAAIMPLEENQPADDVFASLLDLSGSVENNQTEALPELLPASLSGHIETVPVADSRVEDLPHLDALEQEHDAFWTGGLPIVEAKQDAVNPTIPVSPADTGQALNEKPLIYPVYTEDYFLQQGEKIPADMPLEIDSLRPDEHRSLMVMMSFSEWLLHFKSTTERQKEEHKDQRALKTMWQKEKLAAAIEEENEEIPENVFEMAVNSITREDGLMSESLAEIYVKQGKLDKALEMYRKLSLRNPQKNAYFADKIKEILKENQS